MTTVVAARVSAVRLNAEQCWDRLAGSEHGVLGTVHAVRGVDAVPVVFAADRPTIFVPIDTVKQKRTTELQRLDNLAADDRCVVLVDEYHRDWSRLWWVRAHGTAVVTDVVPQVLADRFEAYRAAGAVAAVIAITVTDLTGWTAQQPD